MFGPSEDLILKEQVLTGSGEEGLGRDSRERGHSEGGEEEGPGGLVCTPGLHLSGDNEDGGGERGSEALLIAFSGVFASVTEKWYFAERQTWGPESIWKPPRH